MLLSLIANATPQSADYGTYILMVLIGISCFVYIPIARKRYAVLENEGRLTAAQVSLKIKGLKVVGLGTLVVGTVGICVNVFGIF
jgi:hypothetical protein